ncbi:MAG TPA: glycine cleavage system aminomethyltransferase GcvT [Abditibacteriaceae bacterium]|nr:glycine cleavage system aminomethyltransferase GcvT [Abditibacteriaceae bacterium]
MRQPQSLMNLESSTRLLPTALQRTPLFERHREMGARLVPFAGWEMPVQYEGVIAEVRAVREGCGLFDVSHMGQLRFEGVGVTQWLNTLVSSDWEQTAPGRAAYALLLNESGGVIDDILGYRLSPDAWLVVLNASRAEVDQAHFQSYLRDGIEMSVGGEDAAMIAIQGAQAQDVLQKLIGESLDQVAWRDVILLGGATEAVLARGGYTGCDGFEIMFNADDALQIWNSLIGCGGVPCGLGARDVLRLEAGLPLYGHELRETWTPRESGCGWAVKMDKGEFVGRDALLEKTEASQSIKALKMNGKAIPRDGYRVLDLNGEDIGEITSGTSSPTLGCGIALARLPRELEVGDTVQIEIRNTKHAAQVVKPPFVARGRKQIL